MPHEDAQRGKAFQVQQMQQSLHGQEKSRKTFQNSRDLDQIDEAYLKTPNIAPFVAKI